MTPLSPITSSPHSQNSSSSPQSRKRKLPDSKLFSSKKRKVEERKQDDERFDYLAAKHKDNTLTAAEKKEYRTLCNRRSAEKSRRKQAEKFERLEALNQELQEENDELRREISLLRAAQGNQRCPRCQGMLSGEELCATQENQHTQQVLGVSPMSTQCSAQGMTHQLHQHAAPATTFHQSTPQHSTTPLLTDFDFINDFNFGAPDDMDFLGFDMSSTPRAASFFKAEDATSYSTTPRLYAKFGGWFLLGILVALFVVCGWGIGSTRPMFINSPKTTTNTLMPLNVDSNLSLQQQQQCVTDLTQCLSGLSNHKGSPSFLSDIPHIFVPYSSDSDDTHSMRYLSQTEIDVEMMERANETLDFLNFHRPSHSTLFTTDEMRTEDSMQLSAETQDSQEGITYVYAVSEAPGGKHVYRLEANKRVLSDVFRAQQQLCAEATFQIGGNATQVLSMPLLYSEGSLQMMKLYYLPQTPKHWEARKRQVAYGGSESILSMDGAAQSQ